MGVLVLKTPPASEPVDLAVLKTFMRIEVADTSQDTMLNMLIAGARQYFENATNRALITQTWQYFLDEWPQVPTSAIDLGNGYGLAPMTLATPSSTSIILPRPEFQTLTSIKVTDSTGTQVPFTDFVVGRSAIGAKLSPKAGFSWPDPYEATGGIVIEFVAGYGNDGTLVPLDMKMAIMQLVALWFDNPEMISSGVRGQLINPQELPNGIADVIRARTVIAP